MAGKGIDKVKTQAALDTVRESPGIAAIVAAPVVIGFGVLWWAIGFWPALLSVAVVVAVVVGLRKLRG
ncbi:hypothetical protein ACFWPA_19005 [Rhodococcus sp. NPDC058505]|uniref:hypothetical protein n=1 Tax=Rhodococcus sp. NPDC058505 TaxID=3346531 RepID=UPI0036578132